jgi:hypothetical protein
VALVERVLPGWSILLAITEHRSMANVHSEQLGTTGKWYDAGKACTAPLAILVAMLKAKIAEEATRVTPSE